jgi:hypothetical protein
MQLVVFCMLRLACIAASAALLVAPDVSHVLPVPPASSDPFQISAGENIQVLPTFQTAQGDQKTQEDQPVAPPAADAGPLTPESRLALVRYVSGEYAHMVMPLPTGKDGFHIKAGEPVDAGNLQNAVRSSGAAVNAGDNVQITKVDFRDHTIVLEINGGPRGKRTPWRNRIQLSMGGISTGQTDPNATAAPPPTGAAVFLDFSRPVPDMTAAQLKNYLAVIFDFSKQRSAAVTYAESLPPEIREAIEKKQAEVGMDHEQVLAALGRPDRKVREREEDGTETEDWIYGTPPTKTIFVRFTGEQVTRITQYP